MQNLIDLFKCLSEPVRLRVLCLLSQSDPVCVCDLVDALNLPQSVVSRHLSYLRKHDLVTTYKQGKWSYYQLNLAYHQYSLLNSIIKESILNDAIARDLVLLVEQRSTC